MTPLQLVVQGIVALLCIGGVFYAATPIRPRRHR